MPRGFSQIDPCRVSCRNECKYKKRSNHCYKKLGSLRIRLVSRVTKLNIDNNVTHYLITGFDHMLITMMTGNQKISMIALVAIAAVFVGVISPITTAFAEAIDADGLRNHSDDKTYEGKGGKSCPGKYKSGTGA